jgi:hypothetical protein
MARSSPHSSPWFNWPAIVAESGNQWLDATNYYGSWAYTLYAGFDFLNA